MATTTSLPTATEPFPIFKLSSKYLVYDPDTVSYIRREYNISGVLIGSLPQAAQQNVFLGLPLELMPEEARLLVEMGVANICNDVASHRRAFLDCGLSAEERRAYHAALRKQGAAASRTGTKRAHDRKKAALAKKAQFRDWNDIPEDMLKSSQEREEDRMIEKTESDALATATANDEALFESPTSMSISASLDTHRSATQAEPEPFHITPSTSYPPMQITNAPSRNDDSVSEALPSYHLYKHLHEQGYFLSPGLRFGCQFVAYPGDPLRFHSHFLCNGMDWDQEFDLLDLVGGGRLGTGVKKGFLIGGSADGGIAAGRDDDSKFEVRSFCIEWGGM